MALKVMLGGYMFIFLCRIFEEYPLLGLIHLERIWMIALIAVFLSQRPRPALEGGGKSGLLFSLAVVLLSGIGSAYGESWALTAENFAKIIFFCFVLTMSVKDEDDFRWIIIAYVAIMFLYELKSSYEYLCGRHQFRMGIIRMVGLGEYLSDPNAFASNIIYTIPFALALMRDEALQSPWVRRRLPIAFITLGILCVVMSGSRGGVVTLAFVMSCYFLTVRKGRLKITFIMALAAALTWLLMPDDKKERLVNMFESDDSFEAVHITARQHESAKESAESRLRGFTDGLALMELKPIPGHGAGSFSQARGLVGQDYGLQSHNLLGQVMGELGLLGLAALGYMVLFLLVSNLHLLRGGRPLRPYSLAAVVVTLSLLLNGYGAHSFFRYNWWWLIAFTSILLGLHHRDLAARTLEIKNAVHARRMLDSPPARLGRSLRSGERP